LKHGGGFRLRDAIGIIHRRGYRNQRTDARYRHQSPTDRVITNDREHSLMQLFVFRLQSCPRRKHRHSDAFQGRLARHQFPYPPIKSRACHRPNLQAKTAQNPPDAQFNVDKPPKKLFARNQ
jgi:hypothetical protein